jgi:ADP-dependent NAD(P)H-hydrate dehydratase / NAD(P)H-hydrate epimerase
MKILTAHQMREIDRLTVEQCGVSYATLMETAGARVVEAILRRYGDVEGKSFLILCGKGNNGGDGAVIARLLRMRGARIKVQLFGKLDDAQGEARANLDCVKTLVNSGGIIFDEVGRTPSDVKSHRPAGMTEDKERRLFRPPDFVVDAIFGTGLTRPVEGGISTVISDINEFRKKHGLKVIAVDIPSGLSSDSGQPIGPHIEADLTVTFTSPKIGNVLPPSCHANGKLVVVSIGTPNWLIEEECPSQLYLVAESQVADWLRLSRRAEDAHKGSVGDVLLIAGSRGKTGAAALASGAILRAGAGLVTVATSRSAQSLLVTQTLNEVMTEALDETPDGAISHSALDRALRLAQKRTVVAVGPGLSSADESTRRFVRDFVGQRNTPLVIDADGLNALAPWPEELQGSEEMPIVITPHPGEMARLTGMTIAEVNADRIAVARGFAEKHRVITVLKGNRTVIAAPEKFVDPEYQFTEVYIVPTGNAGMATAGSGDVLTGLVASFLAQSPRLTGEIKLGSGSRDAVVSAVYLHGLAGDIAASKLGMRPLIASDIIANLSEAILLVGGDAERGRTNTISTI